MTDTVQVLQDRLSGYLGRFEPERAKDLNAGWSTQDALDVLDVCNRLASVARAAAVWRDTVYMGEDDPSMVGPINSDLADAVDALDDLNLRT